MGMPVTIHIVGDAQETDIDEVFTYLHYIDDVFSTYKNDSEISKINNGVLRVHDASEEVQEVLDLCDETQQQTHGYFDIHRNGKIDPSGIVKGYAIHESACRLAEKGYLNFSVEIAGDAELVGRNEEGDKWHIGIQNPFDTKEIIKVVALSDYGIATSGNYLQGNHIYNPHTQTMADDIASITVIGFNAYDADRFATAAFAMGENGIAFIEKLPGFEGYMVTKDKKAILTSGFEQFVI